MPTGDRAPVLTRVLGAMTAAYSALVAAIGQVAGFAACWGLLCAASGLRR